MEFRTGRRRASSAGTERARAVRELGRLLRSSATSAGRPAGTPILRPPTVRELTRRQREAMFDDTFEPGDPSGGLEWPSTPNATGASGSPMATALMPPTRRSGIGGSTQSSCGFADPVHELVVAWVFNGLPGERRHQLRAHELNRAIYEDLRLGTNPSHQESVFSPNPAFIPKGLGSPQP